MKLLMLFALILMVSISCDRSTREASPSDPLYKNWKLTETRSRSGAWETVSYESIIGFRADGSIVYQKPEPACCSPIRFERQQQTLKLTDYYGGGDCIYVDCAPPVAYRIVSVTADELILESVYDPTYPAAVSQYTMKYKAASGL
jgi:hypothetical protein